MIVLGAGSRVAMRGAAVLAGQVGELTLGGTLAVIVLGLGSGALGGVILAIGSWLFPRNRTLRATVFWGALTLLTVRGLRPIDVTRVALFAPLVVLYGALLQVSWNRWRERVGR